MLDLLIRNGEVVTPQGVGRWTVGVKGEQIAYVGMDDPSMQAGRTVDAAGKIVVPGGIEPHAHLDIFDLTNPDSGKSTLGPEEDTRGMAFGGTTTHLDFCFVEPSMEITKAIEERCARWRGNSYVDYSFHVGLMGAVPLKTFDQLADVIKQGFPSFKVFTTDVLPPHPKRISVRLDMGRIQLAMENVARNDGIMVVHAEDDEPKGSPPRAAPKDTICTWCTPSSQRNSPLSESFDSPGRATRRFTSCILLRAKASRRWSRPRTWPADLRRNPSSIRIV